MDDTALTELLTTRIDEALDQYRGRDLVAASEITDLLLDLRLMLLAADVEARTPTS
jgi:signal recognition particle GTPase